MYKELLFKFNSLDSCRFDRGLRLQSDLALLYPKTRLHMALAVYYVAKHECHPHESIASILLNLFDNDFFLSTNVSFR